VEIVKKIVRKIIPKKIIEKIDKIKEVRKFLRSKPSESIGSLEIRLFNKLNGIKYTLKELIEMEDWELLQTLQHKKLVNFFYDSLKEEINKRNLDIDLKKYPAFKNFEVKRKDKLS